MRVPRSLRRLDERVLGPGRGPRAARRTEVVEDRPLPTTGEGARQALSIALRVSRLVLLVLAAVVLLGIVFTALPTNADNVIVRNVLSLADRAAGPFSDVFTPSTPDRALYANDALAAGVYVVVAVVLGRLADRLRSRRTA